MPGRAAPMAWAWAAGRRPAQLGSKGSLTMSGAGEGDGAAGRGPEPLMRDRGRGWSRCRRDGRQDSRRLARSSGPSSRRAWGSPGGARGGRPASQVPRWSSSTTRRPVTQQDRGLGKMTYAAAMHTTDRSHPFPSTMRAAAGNTTAAETTSPMGGPGLDRGLDRGAHRGVPAKDGRSAAARLVVERRHRIILGPGNVLPDEDRPRRSMR